MDDKILYMVSVDGAKAPTAIHKSQAEAIKEAIRLSKLPNNREACVRVLRLIGSYVPSSSHEWVEA